MGNKSSKHSKLTTINKEISKMKEINICSLNIDLSVSITLEQKIHIITDLLINNAYKIDVLCLHGVGFTGSTEILKKLVENIIKETNQINKKVYTYPPLNTLGIHLSNSLEATISKSNDDIEEIDSLIISKHKIIDGAKVILDGSNKYVYITNMNIHNNIVSIYTFELTPDKDYTSYKTKRNDEINKINEIIQSNITHIQNSNIDPNTNKINILCSTLNINELVNIQNNNEYSICMRKLNGLDIYRYVRTLKNVEVNKLDATNNKGKRTEYILFLIKEFETIETIQNIKSILYNKYRTIISNCIIIKELKSVLDSYPIIASLYIQEGNNIITTKHKEPVVEID